MPYGFSRVDSEREVAIFAVEKVWRVERQHRFCLVEAHQNCIMVPALVITLHEFVLERPESLFILQIEHSASGKRVYTYQMP